MAFKEILKTLVDRVDGAEGAVMADYDGEPVAEALGVGSSFDRYGIQLLGAQIRATLHRWEDLHERIQAHKPRTLTIRAQERTLLIYILNDRYFVLLAVRNSYGLSTAEHDLEVSGEQIALEM